MKEKLGIRFLKFKENSNTWPMTEGSLSLTDISKKILNRKTFENLFCLEFYKKIMIDPFYLVTEFENMSGVCD